MAITVRSDFWGNNYSLISERNTLSEQISKMFARPGLRREKAIVMALLGVAPGATATVADVRVQANTSENGGKRVIETVNTFSRATTADDVAEIKDAVFNHNPRISTPVDRAKRA